MTEAIMISLILQVSPQNFVGRALAVFTPTYGLALVLSTALAGYLDTLLHGFHAILLSVAFASIDTIFVATGIIAIVEGLYAMVPLRGQIT